MYNKISGVREAEAQWSIVEEYTDIYIYSLWNEGLACLAKRRLIGESIKAVVVEKPVVTREDYYLQRRRCDSL